MRVLVIAFLILLVPNASATDPEEVVENSSERLAETIDNLPSEETLTQLNEVLLERVDVPDPSQVDPSNPCNLYPYAGEACEAALAELGCLTFSNDCAVCLYFVPARNVVSS